MNTAKAYSRRLALGVLLVLAGVGLTACASMKSGSHYDETVAFGDYRTFSWIAEQPLIVGADERPSISPLTQKKIMDAIAGEMRRKGFVYSAEKEAADFIVSYTVGTRERLELTSYPYSYHGAWGGRLYGRNYYYGVEYQQRRYTEGTLGVDIFDGKTKQPVWHGWAEKTVSSADRRDPSPAIAKAVTAIFADFPPPRIP